VSVCLDSWAILAWLDGEEPALSRVEAIIGTRPLTSWVNLVEVYYRVERDHGRIAADATLSDLRAVLSLDLPGTARMIEVARLKARASVALGDCFAVATAAAHGFVLLTGDPEIIELPDRPCQIEDLRSDVTRSALEAHLRGGRRQLRAAAAGHSGKTDISERIEQIISAELGDSAHR
jgi:predicted nucleic acid-binding protein